MTRRPADGEDSRKEFEKWQDWETSPPTRIIMWNAWQASRIAAFDRAIEKLQELAVKNGSANDGYFAALRDAAEILTRERDGVLNG